MNKLLLTSLSVAGLLAGPETVVGQTTPPASARPAGAPGATTPTPRLALPETPKGAGRVTGTVLDATTKKPVQFATVALLPATGETPIDGTACDERGRFALKGLAPGSYRVQISFLGYGNRLENVTVSEGTTDLGNIMLTATTQKLGEVTVTGERDVIETKPDRIVYNAEKDITNSGGTAADVLRKVPLLNVDPEGRVELRGTSNVRVLINNKPSSVVASSVADALKQIPADQIKSVEVITTPSAKYDAEGTGGIINIILKKNSLQGANGSVGLAGGTRSSNANASVNYRKGKFGVNSSLSGFAFYSPSRNNLSRYLKNPDGSEVQALEQEGKGKGLGGGGFGRIGLDYDPAEYHNLTLNFQGSRFGNSNNNQQFNNLLQPAQAANQFTRDTDSEYSSQSYDINGSYTRTFEDKRREWSVLGQHTRNRNVQDYDLEQFEGRDQIAPITYQEQSDNLARNLETTLQTDYAHPFSETALLETGVKAIMRRVSSDYDVYDGLDLNFNPARSNLFDYNQDVVSGYGTYGFSMTKKFNFKLGARIESTRIKGSFEQRQSENSGVSQKYTNLLPNLSVSYQPQNPKKPGQTVRLAYSRRIQRPQIYFLNPFVNASDTLNVSYGYPDLEPELTDSYELNYTTFIKSSTLNLSAYTRRTGNAIESVRFIDQNGVNNQTFRNIGRNNTYGVSVFGSVKPTTKWDVGGNVNVYYVRLESPALSFGDGYVNTSSYSNDGVMYNVNLNSSYRFEKGLSIQSYGGLNSPRVQLQGRQAAWTYYSLGLRKKLLKEKADITLNADNFLSATRNFSSRLDTDQFRQSSNYYIYQRSLRLAFNYRFGKATNQPQRPKRSIRNDDTKQGDSGQGQQ